MDAIIPAKKNGPLPPTAMELSKKKKKKNCQVIAFVKETYFISLLGKILTYFLSTARKFLIERSKEIYQCQGKAHALTNNVTKF